MRKFDPSKRSGGFTDLIEACEIFRKHSDPRCPFHCARDTLYVNAEAEKVSEEDKKRLDELGFFVCKEGGFMSYRFGSC